ncbi:MAG TPA: lysylphosphatidylglycerol synthase transmembrane domain-containing protein [Gaiellaceae bacterium]|nr:lysylphosphatidylglycerol synthase transmembrane domain-containing protein [Gaiellaceae bacterium]
MKAKWWPFLLLIPLLGGAIALIVWRGPDWHAVHDAFSVVTWGWVAAAIGLNLLSVVARSIAWDTTIKQSIEPPHPPYRLVFSAFCVGLFGNAVLPGRVGELARVAVLRRRLSGPRGTTATLIGSVFAHRMFDVFPTIALVVWVLLAAKIPTWAYTSLAAALGVGVLLFAVALLLARRQHRDFEELGPVRLLLARARRGLAVMRAPLPALKAASFQFIGWGCQLFAVWSAMRAFQIHQPLAAAGLVLVLMNVATIFPLWPGNVGLVQIAVATPLVNYGVAYARGIAFGIGLQAIEASVGIGIGLVFLAREGLSYATLKQIDEPVEESVDDVARTEPERARTRISG